jgi:hypothetical protein
MSDETFTIPCDSIKEAQKLRLCFHQIKYATLHTPDHPLKKLVTAKQIIITRNNEVAFRSPADSPLQAWGEKLLLAAEAANAKD